MEDQIAMWQKYDKWTAISVIAVGVFATVAMTPAKTSAKQGRDIFEKRCTGCHALDDTKVGAPLRRVFSRRSASDPKFPYSDELKKAQVTWDAVTLDRWLLNPEAVVPGNDMTFRLESTEERAAIIAYLRELSEK